MWIVIILVIVVLLGFTVFTGAPLVPSWQKDVKEAFTKLYPLSKKDFLIDLGAGTGIVQKIATRYGASSLGIELNPIFANLAKFNLRKDKNATIKCQNFYRTKFPPQTTVVYVFGDGRDILKIYRKVAAETKRLKKPIYLISYGFQVPGIKPTKSHQAYFLYRVKN